MDIIEPSRLPSLGPRAITILSHLDESRIVKLDDPRLNAVFPFETLFSLKQRIAAILGTTPPNQLFIAVETTANHFKPLEFSWPFLTADGLVNPHDPSVKGQPDSRIYEDDAKKPVFPTIYSGITLENTLVAAATVHVWTLESLLQPDQPITEPIFEGFIKLYFPQLRETPKSLRMVPATLQTLTEYRNYIDKRLERLEKGVASATVQDAEVPELTRLYIYKSILPKASNYTASLLELKFYEMIPTPSKPFLRYFSANDRIPSIVKVATNKDGRPFIENEKLLDSLMADKPSMDMGAIILIKRPIDDPKVLGVCWTIRIYEDGSAEMYIGAPRRGVSVSATTTKKALAVLGEMLAGTPWETIEKDKIRLCELTAEYEFNTSLAGRKPGKVELVNRVDTFTPLFSIDPPFEGENPPAALILRYKGVSNYVQTTDPVMNYLTLLYLNRGSKTDVDVPEGAYIKALVKEFGISAEEAAQAEDDWLKRHSEYVIMYKSDAGDDLRIKDLAIRDAKCSAKKAKTTEEDTTVAAYNVGAAIRLYNEHPKYRILITGCETTRDLERMLTLMTLFLSETADTLNVPKTDKVEEAVKETEINTAKEIAQEPPEELEQAFDFGLMNMLQGEEEAGNEEEEEEEEEAEAEAEAPKVQGAVAVPTALAPDETVEAITKEWYLNKLKSRDHDLFQYTDTSEARTKLYSRQCQLTQNRQPNVLSKEAYRRAKELYGDKVRWLEVPLSPDVQKAYDIAVSKTVGQRKSKGSNKEIANMEILMLRKGFALKADASGKRSITEMDTTLKAEKEIIDRLIAEQESKPVWLVTQTGTDAKHINNYICTEFWCVRDDLPLLESEFNGTVGYDGKPKAPKTCPFCRGTVIKVNAKPAIGETVLQRPTSASSGKVAKYSGFLGGLFHPDKYALPCCFVEQKHVAAPEGAKLPEIVPPAAPEAEAPQEAPAPPAPAAPQPVKDIVNRSKPFSPTAKTWYVPNQNVLGRIKLDWFELEKGAIAVPPASVNKFLGQNPEDFLTKNRGVEQQETNSHLLPYRDNTTPSQAFVRYGLGHSPREPGKNFLSLLAWAEYATNEFVIHNDGNVIRTEDQMKNYLDDKLNGTGEVFAARAFEQANYGTLIHEFASLQREGKAPGADKTPEEWCGMMDLLPKEGGETPNAAKQFYYAWHQFKAYVADTRMPKELRLWESLLAVPGLFTDHGILLVRIRVPKNKNEDCVLICPQFGISVHDKAYPPPFMLIVEDEVTGNYDPLILYDGKTEKDKKMYGVIHFQVAGSIDTLPAKVRVPLQTFVEEYVSETGCGRSVPPIHPWLPVREMEFKPPSITDLNSIVDPKLITPETKLLRDRSNRLVGILKVQEDGTRLYIPCVDDGLILMQCASMYGEESLLPPPTLQTIYTAYFKNLEVCDVTSVIAEGLLPKVLRINETKTQYVALDLLCGITIPINPLPLEDPVLKQVCYSKLTAESPLLLKKGTEPWFADLALMAPQTPTKSLEAATKEEELEEAYQHLRITLSEFLLTEPKGKALKAQIEKLRQARRRLPLFELQRRLDALLYPYVNQWVKRDDKRPAAKPSVLRRECTQITKETDCIEGCSWSAGEAPLRQCLIHTTATERFLDPVHLMSARLTDELLRTFGKAMEILNHTVSRLKPLQSNEFRYENSSLLFSAVGRGTQLLYDILGYSKRQPTDYTAGLTYPEEVGLDESLIELPEDWKEALYRIVVSPYLSKDPRGFLNEVMHLAKFIPADKTFGGTQEEWIQLAKALNINVLKTHYNSVTNRIQVSTSDMILESTADNPNYIILDVTGIPLQNKKTTAFTLREDELPASIKMALD